MDVWIKQWDYPQDMESTVTVWTTENGALQSACDEIQSRIDGDWDMDNADMFQYSEEIDTLLSQKRYREAMDKWNDFQSTFNDEYAEYWSVYQQTIQGDSQGNVVTSAPSIAFKAASPGATCRGQCKNYSPDAYADRPDGTYHCRQCKIFQGIFSP